MEKMIIGGGIPLQGRVKIDGMKNAAVAVIFASIVTCDKCIIGNLPNIDDVDVSLEILRSVGANVVKTDKNTVEIDTTNVKNVPAPSDLVHRMRASYYFTGAMLARFGEAHMGMPGGCDLGARPIDQHIKAFRALGANADIVNDNIDAEARDGLFGTEIFFDCVTVGGTINAMIAAMGAHGVTVINNAAREPHVVDLANFLNTCGAKITGAGTDVIKIKRGALHGCTYDIIPDMLEAGCYMIAAAATRGSVYVDGIILKHIESISAKLAEMNVKISEFDDGVLVSAPERLVGTNVKTLPYPGFPTDMQPLMAVLMCIANGTGTINETIFENRFRYAEELRRMGARISVSNGRAEIVGVEKLHAASVRAVDLRAGAAMMIAALATEGYTEIDDIYHIERGYSDIIQKLKALGADIKKVDNTNV